MSTPSEQGNPGPRHQTPAQANEAIRAFVRAHGDRPWSRAELAELDRLRAVWRAAGRAGMTTAA
ncbi:hypothetical protein F0L17_05075 [Streptomyces sp. TRM43335]|uniref:Uncharacterized protein n=1 Tax=Streptomyces taklimakanensis TaxID=2569853 RepID=A0A6G2B8C7_9ACTN|nr:hypothetical protein [Streptomyces taklimakanensis]MTE18510.1 hypothetical protein [Streptomyces taklimakanensis]